MRVAAGGAGPQVSGSLRALPFLDRRSDGRLARALRLPVTSVSLLYVPTPTKKDEAKSCTEVQLGAHPPSSKPFPRGLLVPRAAPRSRLADGMGLTPRLVAGLGLPLESSEVDVEVAEACRALGSLRLRGRTAPWAESPRFADEDIGDGQRGTPARVGRSREHQAVAPGIENSWSARRVRLSSTAKDAKAHRRIRSARQAGLIIWRRPSVGCFEVGFYCESSAGRRFRKRVASNSNGLAVGLNAEPIARLAVGWLQLDAGLEKGAKEVQVGSH